jgi:hypothetical protein
MKTYKQGIFTVKVSLKGSKYLGLVYENDQFLCEVESVESSNDCELKGLAYARSLNDMPTNYKLKEFV